MCLWVAFSALKRFKCAAFELDSILSRVNTHPILWPFTQKTTATFYFCNYIY